MRLVWSCLAFAVALSASDWPRYRGPNGTGVSDETGLPDRLDKDANVAWKTAVPLGNSSPVVIDSRLYITGYDGEQRLLLAIDASTGKEIWRQATKRDRIDTPHPRNGFATPSVARRCISWSL